MTRAVHDEKGDGLQVTELVLLGFTLPTVRFPVILRRAAGALEKRLTAHASTADSTKCGAVVAAARARAASSLWYLDVSCKFWGVGSCRVPWEALATMESDGDLPNTNGPREGSWRG